MTIVFGGRILLSKEPVKEDMQLLADMQAAREKWISEGRPASGSGC
ncbi:hypothetical protein ACM25O_13220 [Sulfitobacter pontiacus]